MFDVALPVSGQSQVSSWSTWRAPSRSVWRFRRTCLCEPIGWFV